MKKLLLIITILFISSTLLAQKNAIVPEKVRLELQLQQAQAEITRLNVVLKDVKADRDALTIAIATMSAQTKTLNQGIIKATGILQAGIDSGGKVEFQKLIDMGFNLVISKPADKGKKPNKDRPQE